WGCCIVYVCTYVFFFFQAEDGIRDFHVTGVQTCALPIFREGMLLRGPSGWGEFCPFDDYGDAASVPWLAAALEQCTGAWPTPVRTRIPINCTVPAVDPNTAHDIVKRSGCRTAKVKVADHPGSLAEDQIRVEAVRDAPGPE